MSTVVVDPSSPVDGRWRNFQQQVWAHQQQIHRQIHHQSN